jgi:hypothetical protein
MANAYTNLLAVTGGKRDLKMKVRVAHVWCMPSKKDPNDITFMKILLVDDKVGFVSPYKCYETAPELLR